MTRCPRGGFSWEYSLVSASAWVLSWLPELHTCSPLQCTMEEFLRANQHAGPMVVLKHSTALSHTKGKA